MRRAAAIAVLLALVTAGFAVRAQLQRYERATLTIDTPKGASKFSIELALSPEQQEQGLMFRREMAPDAGMLFVFPQTQPAVFWMKNTLIPLDMLFIAEDGRIADLHERAVPLSEANIVSKVPVRAVLELNGGTAARLGIRPGGTVHYPLFGTAG